MTSQTGQQIITIHIFTNISRRKYNQRMKFGQVIIIAWEIFFFKNNVENEVERLVSDFFLLFKKAFYKVKASAQRLSFNMFW